jgi:hypothetical protein
VCVFGRDVSALVRGGKGIGDDAGKGGNDVTSEVEDQVLCRSFGHLDNVVS